MTKITLKQAIDLCTSGNSDEEILLKAEQDPKNSPWREYTIERASEELDMNKTLVSGIRYMVGEYGFEVEDLVLIVAE